ncbi:uncharacterized protein LOC107266164 isoform X2 [Cephus cinctus]|uniref:Uncharacterized protein LOC107266164 isoform X2 n=1 Tax=Cephus cinctus TaxID=211228 RepID=A0AAJ7VZQ3_CEPCN|nr:uncharacterized protein LOC107266164 isoform X2 [Cephus cinctus]
MPRSKDINYSKLQTEEDGLDTMSKKSKRRKNVKIKKDPRLLFFSSIDIYAQPLRWWEREPVKYALSYPPVRTRLEMLMGSNVVRLTDRKYMLKLMSRIRQDYESQQKIRIEERKKNELTRTKKMILNRLIPVQEAPMELRKYPLFQLYLYCDAIIEEKRKRRIPKKARMTESLYRLLYPDEKNDEEVNEDDEEEIYMKTVYINGSPELVPMSPQEISDLKREQEAVKDIEDGYMLTQEEYDRLHYETEAVKELRETQTVEEMYAKAYEIVGILYSYVDEGRYKKAAEEKNAGDKNTEEGPVDTSATIGESEKRPETDV